MRLRRQPIYKGIPLVLRQTFGNHDWMSVFYYHLAFRGEAWRICSHPGDATAERARQPNRLRQLTIQRRGTHSHDRSIMKNKIESLQGLRAYAAIAVVLAHARLLFPGGASVGGLGVHLFFVISGFIMAHICV